MASRSSLASRGLVGALKLISVGLHDWLRSRFGLEPAYVKLVGREGSLSIMQLTAEEEIAYHSKHPKVYQVRSIKEGVGIQIKPYTEYLSRWSEMNNNPSQTLLA